MGIVGEIRKTGSRAKKLGKKTVSSVGEGLGDLFEGDDGNIGTGIASGIDIAAEAVDIAKDAPPPLPPPVDAAAERAKAIDIGAEGEAARRAEDIVRRKAKGRQSTILTGPLGLEEEEEEGGLSGPRIKRKTLLGQ